MQKLTSDLTVNENYPHTSHLLTPLVILQIQPDVKLVLHLELVGIIARRRQLEDGPRQPGQEVCRDAHFLGGVIPCNIIQQNIILRHI